MNLTLQMKLLPRDEQKPVLFATIERFNEAATFAAKAGFEAGVFSQPSIHKLCYKEIRQRFGLSAQMAVRAIGKAVECFKRDKTVCPVFKPRGAVTYDQRILGFKGLDKVSLWVLGGRMILPLLYGEYQGERFDRIKGQCDLVYRDGRFYLFVTIEMPEGAPIEPKGFLGVDLGIVNIATDSDGETHSGEDVERNRRKHHENRKRFQKRGSKGTKKRLKKLAGREARFRRHENHRISKALVKKAKDTGAALGWKISMAFATGQRFEPKTAPVRWGGASFNCGRSWSTRPSLPAYRSYWSIRVTRPGRVTSAAIARRPTARARPSSLASIAGTPRTPTETLP